MRKHHNFPLKQYLDPPRDSRTRNGKRKSPKSRAEHLTRALAEAELSVAQMLTAYYHSSNTVSAPNAGAFFFQDSSLSIQSSRGPDPCRFHIVLDMRFSNGRLASPSGI